MRELFFYMVFVFGVIGSFSFYIWLFYKLCAGFSIGEGVCAHEFRKEEFHSQFSYTIHLICKKCRFVETKTTPYIPKWEI